jgi:hypothetical protein
MNRSRSGLLLRRALWGVGLSLLLPLPSQVRAQSSRPASPSTQQPVSLPKDAKAGLQYSGMYAFLREGEFVQVTIENEGRVTGFVSRYGDGDSDKGAFLDLFFTSGKLEDSKLSFTTETVHAASFEFKGTVERGEGKNPGDEAYYVLKGTLTENSGDASKKISSRSREVTFKMFPQDMGRQASK